MTLRIYLEEQRLIKYYVKRHLIMLKTQYMMDIKDLASMVYEFHNKITLDGTVNKRNYAKPANG